jgi:two-component system phosphate regulon sensor histidine kinase PhoR
LRPSRRLIVLLFAITVVPLVSLLWLGHFLLEQDKQDAASQEAQRLAQIADLVATTAERAIADDERRLAAGLRDWPDGAVMITQAGNQLTAAPAGRLAYYPVVPALAEADLRLFGPVDHAEFQLRDLSRATELLEALAESSDVSVQAAARLRLARIAEARGDAERALAIYPSLEAIDSAAISGTPVSLIARYQRCRLFARLGRSQPLRTEAASFRHDLTTGRWFLTAPVYSLYLKDAKAWSDGSGTPTTDAERLAAALDTFWKEVLPAGVINAPRRQMLSVGTEEFGVLSLTHDTGKAALIATPEYVRDKWLERALNASAANQVVLAVSTGPVPDEPGSVVRRADKTGLPWSFSVTRLPSALPSQATSRRTPLLVGLTVLIIMALGSSYFIARAVHREIAVARMQSDFVAAVSHEFRTPLTALRQFTDMLRENPALDESQQRMCFDAQARATERLTNLVESVLDFGSMEAGKRAYQFEQISCGEIVRSVIDDFQREVQPAGYHIDYEEESTADIEADPEALGRALRNLLENAVKYSPGQRRVGVTVSRQASHVAVAVRDRGIGILPSERRAIFDRFHRGDEARTRGIKGTGIGLAMVDHIVKAHGGRVDVESQPGNGSTFTIVLPAISDRSIAHTV